MSNLICLIFIPRFFWTSSCIVWYPGIHQDKICYEPVTIFTELVGEEMENLDEKMINVEMTEGWFRQKLILINFHRGIFKKQNGDMEEANRIFNRLMISGSTMLENKTQEGQDPRIVKVNQYLMNRQTGGYFVEGPICCDVNNAKTALSSFGKAGTSPDTPIMISCRDHPLLAQKDKSS